MSKATTEQPVTKTLAELGLENFEVVEIHRRELVNSPYNPRKITDQEKAKLKKAMARHGLVSPITWNARTKFIVGGHQRISVLDSIAGTSDYTLKVARIDVDPTKEREINVLLNNAQAGGSFDLELLKPMFDDPEVSIEGAGFTPNDMVSMFGTGVFDNRAADLEDFADHLSQISEKYSKVAEVNKAKGENEHYLVFVFPDGAHADALIEALKLEPNRYQNGQYLMDKLGVASPKG